MSAQRFSLRRCGLGVAFVLLVFVGCQQLLAHYALAFDPHAERCLPMKLALLVKNPTPALARQNWVFFKPYGVLSFVRDRWIIKAVAGLPGDRLTVRGDEVRINGQLVAKGFPLAQRPASSGRDEIIPPGQLFVVGRHPRSYDSRYWGYLPIRQVEGRAYALF